MLQTSIDLLAQNDAKQRVIEHSALSLHVQYKQRQFHLCTIFHLGQQKQSSCKIVCAPAGAEAMRWKYAICIQIQFSTLVVLRPYVS